MLVVVSQNDDPLPNLYKNLMLRHVALNERFKKLVARNKELEQTLENMENTQNDEMSVPYKPTLRRIIQEELGGHATRGVNPNDGENEADVTLIDDDTKVRWKYLHSFFQHQHLLCQNIILLTKNV